MARARAAVAISTAAQARASSTITYSLARGGNSAQVAAVQFSRSPFQPHATTTIVAGGAFRDQFDPGGRKRIDEFHQRIDVPAHDPAARFHALDRRQRKS